MNGLLIDISAIGALIETLSGAVIQARQASGEQAREDDDPGLIREALAQFLFIGERLQGGGEERPALSEAELLDLGAQALTLVDGLAGWVTRLGLREQAPELARLYVLLGVWLARHAAGAPDLETIANGFAALANRTFEAHALTELAGLLGEVIDAAPPAVRQDLERSNPGRPWRVLHLNWAILATRTHDPRLMEAVFQVLVQRLPEEAPAFFTQGMQQMDALNYPPRVRSVMERYYNAWSTRTLH